MRQIPSTIPLPAAFRTLLSEGVQASFDAAVTIAEKVGAAGGMAYLVGGCVRDTLLGETVKDFDLEVYGLEPEVLETLCAEVGPVNDVGRSFGVLKVGVPGGPDVDVSIPRTDSKVHAGHRGFAVATDPRMPMEEAVRRRDFTINALLADPLTGQVFDPAGGRADLEASILRVVDPASFGEDPLRVVRALQFIGRFALSIAPDSVPVLRAVIPSLRELPPERLYEEWRKLLLKSPAPSLGLEAGRTLGLIASLHPELELLTTTAQEPAWHPEGTVWTHTCMAVDCAAAIVRREKLSDEDAWTVLLATLCHDLGKPGTTQEIDGRIRTPGHAAAGVDPAETFMATINVDLRTRAKVTHLVREHMHAPALYRDETKGLNISDGTIRRLAKRLAPATIAELALVIEADSLGRGPFPAGKRDDAHLIGPWLRARAASLGVEHAGPADLVQGRDLLALGFSAGPAFGEIIALANDLRDDAAMSREDVSALLTGASTPEEALQRLRQAAS